MSHEASWGRDPKDMSVEEQQLLGRPTWQRGANLTQTTMNEWLDQTFAVAAREKERRRQKEEDGRAEGGRQQSSSSGIIRILPPAMGRSRRPPQDESPVIRVYPVRPGAAIPARSSVKGPMEPKDVGIQVSMPAPRPRMADSVTQWLEADQHLLERGRRHPLVHSYSGSSFPHGLGFPPGNAEVIRRRIELVTAAPTPANEDGPYGHLPFFGVVVGILNTANVGFTAQGIISEARIGSILRLVGYTFDLEEILDDLITARQRGVIVQVMLDKEESSHGSASAAGQFQQVRAMMVEGSPPL